MIERYSRLEMANIWTEENKYRAWQRWKYLADRHGLSGRNPERRLIGFDS